MIYPSVGKRTKGKMTVSAFSGGVNLRDLPSEAADDQLIDVNNFQYENGVLTTRPAVRVVSQESAEGARMYAAVPDERYLLRKSGIRVIAGRINADGTEEWNAESAGLAGGSALRVPFRAEALDGWTAGATDGTLMYFANGTVAAPLADGGYEVADEFLYVPQILTGGSGAAALWDMPPAAEQTEECNLLTPAFRAGYTTDGNGKYFYLPKKADPTSEIHATLTDKYGQAFAHRLRADATVEEEAADDGLRMAISRTRNCIYFVQEDSDTAVAPDHAGISDNLMISAEAKDAVTVSIGRMTRACWFGGTNSGLSGGTRLFVAGDPDHPNRVYWSDVENPLYFPETNYVGVGDLDGAVTAFGKQGKMLVIFKEREIFAMTYISRIGQTDLSEVCLTLFPLHNAVGCDCPATVRLCNNRLVWLTGDGMVYTLTGDNAYSQCNVRPIAQLIAPQLKAAGRAALQAASAARYGEWYLLLVSHTVWALCYANGAFERVSSYAAGDSAAQNGLAWFRWTMPATLWTERLIESDGAVILIDSSGDRYLFGGTKDAVRRDDEVTEYPIDGSLTTKYYDFGHASRRKCIEDITLSVGSAVGCEMAVSYRTDHGDHADCRRFSVPAVDADEAAFPGVFRLTPHAAHVRRFGMRVDVTGAAVIGTVIVRYALDNRPEKGGE